MGPPAPEIQEPAPLPVPAAAEPAEPRTKPKSSVRPYVATTASVDRFGPMVAAEAQRRNFTEAAARAWPGVLRPAFIAGPVLCAQLRGLMRTADPFALPPDMSDFDKLARMARARWLGW